MSADTASPQIALAREAVSCPRWKWMDGMLVHTTHKGGFPACPAGTPLRIDSMDTLEDAVTEGMFGPITPEPSHAHPRFEDLLELSEKDREAAWARVLPDLDEPATYGCLDALVRGLFDDPYVHLNRVHVFVSDESGRQRLALWWCLVNYRCEPVLLDGEKAVAGPTRAAALVAVLKRMP